MQGSNGMLGLGLVTGLAVLLSSCLSSLMVGVTALPALAFPFAFKTVQAFDLLAAPVLPIDQLLVASGDSDGDAAIHAGLAHPRGARGLVGRR